MVRNLKHCYTAYRHLFPTFSTLSISQSPHALPMATITAIKARQIFDSRGNPTVEVDLTCSDGTFARAAVPSGASTGIYEALELRDGGSDYLGKGVSKAVDNVNKIIAPALIGKDPTKQTEIDNFMVQQLDGTVNEWGWCKQKLGANAILAVPLAVCKTGASVLKTPLYKHIANLAGNKKLVLPVPSFNVINGGSHAGNKLAMQEFMILPVGASTFKEAMKICVEVYHHLKSVIKKKYGQDAVNVGDEGGFPPNIQENKEGLELLKTAIAKAGYTGKVVIGMDVAASEFYKSDKTYDLNFKEEALSAEADPKYDIKLKKVEKFKSFLARGRTITAKRFLKSLVFSKSPFSSPSELHAFVAKPLFSDTLLWTCSVPELLNEATELYYSMRKDGFSPSTRSFNRLLQIMVNSKQYEKALSLFSDFVGSGIRVDTSLYENGVLAAAMLRDLKKCFELLDSMEKEGTRPSVFVYNVVIGLLCKMRKIRDARKMFDEMVKKNLAPNTVTYNTLIDVFCKVGELEEAFSLRERMKTQKVEPFILTYNALLSGLCGSGRLEDARKLLLEMEAGGFLPGGFSLLVFDDDQSMCASDDGSLDRKVFGKGELERINEHTYCILLNGLCRVGKVEKAKEVLTKLVNNGVIPSKISYNILVNGYCQEGDLKKAILTAEQMEEQGVKANNVTFNTLINKLCETKELDQAERWVKKMIEKGVSPTVETYNSLINGYGRMCNFVRCFEILEEMEKIGIKPNVISYGALINCLCKDRKLLDAEIVLADMIGRGVSPNAEIYNMLIEASCSLHKLKDAHRFFDEMVKIGRDPTLVTYNTLINGLGKMGKVRKAEDMFLKMTSKGFNPDVISYNSLISGYANSGNSKKCIELYENMKSLGIKPSIGTFHPLIFACRKEGMATVERIFQEMLQMDLLPDRVVYNEMMCSYAEEGDVEKAMSLHQQMVDQGVDCDKVTYNCLILGCLRDRKVSEVKHLMDDMKAKGLAPKFDTYNILVKGHCNIKDFYGAYFWYREMFDRGMLLNPRICYQLLIGLREEGMLREAQILSSELSNRGLNS